MYQVLEDFYIKGKLFPAGSKVTDGDLGGFKTTILRDGKVTPYVEPKIKEAKVEPEKLKG